MLMRFPLSRSPVIVGQPGGGARRVRDVPPPPSSPSLRPFRFGVSAWRSWDPAAWRSLARDLEATGVSTLLLADHLVEGAPPPLLAMAAAAEVTDRLGLGTFVLNNDFHRPAWLAR